MDQIRIRQPKIAVIGDLMIDRYIWGKCNRISPEAPVQIISTTKEEYLLGGAGNVISNLVALNAKVGIYSVIGDNSNASRLRKLIENLPLINQVLICESGRITTQKSRVIASGQQVLRIDDETTEPIGTASQNMLLESLQKHIGSYDAILLSDYGKGVLTDSLCQEIINQAKRFHIPVLADPKGMDYSKYKGATLLTPNKKEASLATKTEITDDSSLSEALHYLKDKINLKYAIITLSEDGIAILDKKVQKIPTVAREVFDVTGAGDTVLASLGVALASGVEIVNACKFANRAAAVVVSKVGSATATLNEIETYGHPSDKNQAKDKIKNTTQITDIVKRLKEQKYKIIFTNGCFDIMHRGHASYLEKAKALGDILIVGLNSDESITRLKGKNRPVNNLEDRAFLLAAMQSVDYVVPFGEDTPYNLIEQIRPHMLVKGADYKNKDIIGSDIVDKVVLIEFVKDKSTTQIIEKITKDISC